MFVSTRCVGFDEACLAAARILRGLLFVSRLSYIFWSAYMWNISKATGWTLTYPFMFTTVLCFGNNLSFRQNLFVNVAATWTLLPPLLTRCSFFSSLLAQSKILPLGPSVSFGLANCWVRNIFFFLAHYVSTVFFGPGNRWFQMSSFASSTSRDW